MSLGKLDIVTCLWFNGDALEAAKHYTSIFKNSKITATFYYSDVGSDVHGREPGSVMTVNFELDGYKFFGLNGGPLFKFSEAVSFQIQCDTQEEIDYYWSKLGEGGDPAKHACGWLGDKFGLSWQITPRVMSEFLGDKDRAKSDRAMKAMMEMKKLDIAELKRAFEGEE